MSDNIFKGTNCEFDTMVSSEQMTLDGKGFDVNRQRYFKKTNEEMCRKQVFVVYFNSLF